MTNDAGGMRASDAEREQTAESLREHYAAGRLSGDELDERLEASYGARTVQELRSLREDLPELPLPTAALRADLVRRRAELRRRLLQHAGGSFTPFAICTLIWAASGANDSFWPVWVLIFPLVFVLRNAWRLYGPAPELDRVQAELEHRSGGGGPRRRHRHSSGPRRRELS
jgi:uncharacterized membrane protein YccC